LRKRIALLLGIGLTFIMAFGVLGSGAGLTFTGTASQTLTVGQMTIEVTSTTPGATVVMTATGPQVNCPAFFISTSSSPFPTGGPTCNVTLNSTGTIAPLNLSVLMQSTTTGANLGSFQVSPTGLPGMTPKTLSAGLTSLGIASPPVFPVSIDLPIAWGWPAGLDDLTNSDMGKAVTVSYQFNIAQ
jgi:hypothetical protein